MPSHFHLLSVSTLLLAAVPLVPAIAQTSSAPSQQEPARQLQVLLDAAYPADGPGAAVMVSRGGRTIFAGGRGMADIAARRKITVDTPFYLGSITKTFTATLILKLVEEGKLSLDDPIAKHVPGFPEPAARATIRHLLNHSSGIADYSKLPGFIAQNRDKQFSSAALLEVMKCLAPVAAPGEKWEYNNGGYVLLGIIAENVTRQTWPEALRSRITAPLKLRSVMPPSSGPRRAAGCRSTPGWSRSRTRRRGST